MKNRCATLLLSSFLSLVLTACASVSLTPRNEALFDDRLFAAPSEHVGAEDLFALTPEMKEYLANRIMPDARARGSQLGLFDALYAKGQLKLEYDSARTLNAAQAFKARSGNCLSLVIMTAAFAREMGMPVTYQSAFMDESWGRSGDVHFFIGHVNVTLGKSPFHVSNKTNMVIQREENELTIDFLLPQEIRGLNTRIIEEETIVAMYMNNRAAESFSEGKLDDAYWWARAAIVQDPRFISAYNTLGVIYRRHGNLAESQKTLAYAMEREPKNAHIMSNMVLVLNDLGRTAEANALASKVAQVDPNPAFSFFMDGMVAMRKGDYRTARDLFEKEVKRAPYYHEFHFWLAAAYIGLGNFTRAQAELDIAMQTSTTRNARDLYAAKLDRIKAQSVQ
jgi:tetratricopeptide (TPR) repeat protein